jgi:actin-related protein 6
LTNYLAELLAIHEISLKEDPWIANELKEAVCYVSDNFKHDMERTWRGHHMDPSIVVDCQLPDYQENSNVIIKPFEAKDQLHKSKFNITTVGNERYQVPEILFNPGDVGLAQAGLPELIVQCINTLPEGLRPVMFENILAVGGNSKIPGYVKRL